MKYLSLFSGIGGFELGIQQAYELQKVGTKSKNSTNTKSGTSQHSERPLCIGYSEIDKYAIQVYQKHFPNHKNYGDITKIITSELPDFDLLVGGFPCQSFSIAGKRGGFQDTRGTLFFEIARIAKDKRPRLVLLENVKGLLSHENGKTFRTIIATLDELGYDLQWQVLNSKNFGVPQNRERVFIIGHLRGTTRPKVFPFAGTDQKDTRIIGEDVAYTIDANYHKGTNTLEKSRRSMVQVNHPKHSNDRVYGDLGLSPTLNTMQGGRRQPKIVASRGRNPSNPSDRTTGSPTEQRLEPNEQGISNTLTNVQKDNWLLQDMKIRRLTPKECERLMGFPDDWTAEGTEGKVSDTQRYKMCGNGVVTNVVQAIMEKLI